MAEAAKSGGGGVAAAQMENRACRISHCEFARAFARAHTHTQSLTRQRESTDDFLFLSLNCDRNRQHFRKISQWRKLTRKHIM